MRDEKTMMELILGVARADARVSAVILSGSRADPNAERDDLMDYDIIYVVDSAQPFCEDDGWISVFGEPLVVQCPDLLDEIAGMPADFSNSFAYLMQFSDGTRIDLTLKTLDAAKKELESGEPAVVLYDRDNRFADLPPASDRVFWTREPTSELFFRCQNEFDWVSLYVAKGVARGRLTYAMDCLNFYLRPCVLDMLRWRAGVECGFSQSFGKSGYRLEHKLGAATWQRYLDTFPSCTAVGIHAALRASYAVFKESAQLVADRFGFEYSPRELDRVAEYADELCSRQTDEAL